MSSYKGTWCIQCGRPHGLIESDAGSDREIMRLCESCYDANRMSSEWEQRCLLSEEEANCFRGALVQAQHRKTLAAVVSELERMARQAALSSNVTDRGKHQGLRIAADHFKRLMEE